jgi:hypothetical protein
MGALQITLGVIGVAVSLVAWVAFVAGVLRQVRTIGLGQPDPTRRGPFGPRFATMVKEFAAHTRMNKFRHVGPWHWMVMWGFLIGSAAWFEAYGETFNPHFAWPIIGRWSLWNLLTELLGLGTVIGGVALVIIRQLNHPRRADRQSRFAGSNFWQAYFVEAVVIIEGLGILGVKAFKLSSGVEDLPLWTSFVTKPISDLLPASQNAITITADDLALRRRPEPHDGRRLAPVQRVLQHLFQARTRRRGSARQAQADDERRQGARPRRGRPGHRHLRCRQGRGLQLEGLAGLLDVHRVRALPVAVPRVEHR